MIEDEDFDHAMRHMLYVLVFVAVIVLILLFLGFVVGVFRGDAPSVAKKVSGTAYDHLRPTMQRKV
jgi:hypothetical protein